MEELKTITQEIGEPKFDTLRFGLQSVKGEIVGSHPLESAFHTTKVRHQQMKRQILANAYGSAFPLKMEFDREILSKRFQRPPGAISSSYLGLEAMTGAFEDFGFEDYLNGDGSDLALQKYILLGHLLQIRGNLKISARLTCIMEWKCVLEFPKDLSAAVSHEAFSSHDWERIAFIMY